MEKIKIEKTFEGLPEKSFFKHNMTGDTIMIKRGERCYYKLQDDMKYREPDELNARFNVSKAQAEAMFIGSMFGWDIPASDPREYDENGHMDSK